MLRKKTQLLGKSLFAAIALTVASANAAIVFRDNFEPTISGSNATSLLGTGTTPDVSTYTVANTSGQANTTLWVRGTAGFNASRSGLVDESENSGDNFVDVSGSQAYGSRFTNSGVTSAEGTIGSLAVGQTITFSFDAAYDLAISNGNIRAAIVLFDTGATRNALNGSINIDTAAVLAYFTPTSLSAPSSGPAGFTSYSFSYTVGDDVYDNDGEGGGTGTSWDVGLLGKDIGIRWSNGSSGAHALVDNVVMDITVIPEPSAALLGGLGLLALLRRRRQ